MLCFVVLCAVLAVLCAVLSCMRSKTNTTRHNKKKTKVRPVKPSEDPLNGTQIYVVLVSVGTVALWCCNSALAPIAGKRLCLLCAPNACMLPLAPSFQTPTNPPQTPT